MADRPETERRAPEVIRRYFAAHDQRDSDAALRAFAPDATVVDDGNTYVGPDRIRHWLEKASTEFTYTRTLVDAEVVEAGSWLVTNRLEGNFPGGIVDLRYQFVLKDDLIAELVIAP